MDVPIEDVHEALGHRVFPNDYFWDAWDSNVSEGVGLFCEVTGKPRPGRED